MQRPIKKGLIALSVLIAFFVSNASLAEPKFAVGGAGSVSCGQYLKPPSGNKEVSDMLVIVWMQGYLSGTNTQRFIDTKTRMKMQPDPESIAAFIDQFCRNNPLKNVYQAAVALDSSS